MSASNSAFYSINDLKMYYETLCTYAKKHPSATTYTQAIVVLLEIVNNIGKEIPVPHNHITWFTRRAKNVDMIFESQSLGDLKTITQDIINGCPQLSKICDENTSTILKTNAKIEILDPIANASKAVAKEIEAAEKKSKKDHDAERPFIPALFKTNVSLTEIGKTLRTNLLTELNKTLNGNNQAALHLNITKIVQFADINLSFSILNISIYYIYAKAFALLIKSKRDAIVYFQYCIQLCQQFNIMALNNKNSELDNSILSNNNEILFYSYLKLAKLLKSDGNINIILKYLDDASLLVEKYPFAIPETELYALFNAYYKNAIEFQTACPNLESLFIEPEIEINALAIESEITQIKVLIQCAERALKLYETTKIDKINISSIYHTYVTMLLYHAAGEKFNNHTAEAITLFKKAEVYLDKFPSEIERKWINADLMQLYLKKCISADTEDPTEADNLAWLKYCKLYIDYSQKYIASCVGLDFDIDIDLTKLTENKNEFVEEALAYTKTTTDIFWMQYFLKQIMKVIDTFEIKDEKLQSIFQECQKKLTEAQPSPQKEKLSKKRSSLFSTQGQAIKKRKQEEPEKSSINRPQSLGRN